MAKALVRDIQAGDVEYVLEHMRDPDRAECDALFGPGHQEQMLKRSVASSLLCWALCFDDVPAAVFGVSPVEGALSELGAPWLIGTSAIDRNRGAFIKLNPPYIRRMLEAFPLLVNQVHCKNVKSVAYLKRMGFQMLDPIKVGPGGEVFYPFFMGNLSLA